MRTRVEAHPAGQVAGVEVAAVEVEVVAVPIEVAAAVGPAAAGASPDCLHNLLPMAALAACCWPSFSLSSS